MIKRPQIGHKEPILVILGKIPSRQLLEQVYPQLSAMLFNLGQHCCNLVVTEFMHKVVMESNEHSPKKFGSIRCVDFGNMWIQQ
jgi:hypothetical protein